MAYTEQHRVDVPSSNGNEIEPEQFFNELTHMLAAVNVDARPISAWTFRVEPRDLDGMEPYVLIAEVERA